MDIKILVATHKSAQMPDSHIYLPIHVGAEGKQPLGFTGDNTGDNISIKNPIYCELTGVYWAWKKLNCDVIGLVHYRRYFGEKNKTDFFEGVMKENEISELISRYDIILPKPRNYYIETVREHFHNHLRVFTKTDYIEYLEETIHKLYPEYYDDFQKCFAQKKAHMCNMFIMKKKDFDSYCQWLFSILTYLDKNHSSFTDEDVMPRIYGFIGELLLDVYVTHNKMNYYEKNVIEKDTQSKALKIFNFCKRKFLGIR